MSFTNLFRRHDGQTTIYACFDANSTAETLLEELESQCRVIAMPKRNSSSMEKTEGNLLNVASTTKRHSSVDYSWLTPQNNLLQVKNESYHLAEIVKMELNALIQNVLPEDCASVVNQFRRRIRSAAKGTTPENVIAIFRQTIADYIDEKKASTHNDTEHSTSKLSKFTRHHRVLPKFPSEEEQQQQHSVAELTQISLTSSMSESNEMKPRSNTCI